MSWSQIQKEGPLGASSANPVRAETPGEVKTRDGVAQHTVNAQGVEALLGEMLLELRHMRRQLELMTETEDAYSD